MVALPVRQMLMGVGWACLEHAGWRWMLAPTVQERVMHVEMQFAGRSFAYRATVPQIAPADREPTPRHSPPGQERRVLGPT